VRFLSIRGVKFGGGVLEEKMVAEPGRWRRRPKVDARV
jgi:hypothetical protein